MRGRKLLVFGLAGVLATTAAVAFFGGGPSEADISALVATMDTANDDLTTIHSMPDLEPVSKLKPLVTKLGTDWQAIVVAARKVKGVYVVQVEGDSDSVQEQVQAIVAMPDSAFVADAGTARLFPADATMLSSTLSSKMPGSGAPYIYTPQATPSASSVPGIEVVGDEHWGKLSGWIPTVWRSGPNKASRYQVKFEDRTQVVASASYTNGTYFKVSQGIVVVSVIDLQSQEMVGTRTFTGQRPPYVEPPESQYNTYDARSDPDDREFATWLRDLLSTLGY